MDGGSGSRVCLNPELPGSRCPGDRVVGYVGFGVRVRAMFSLFLGEHLEVQMGSKVDIKYYVHG